MTLPKREIPDYIRIKRYFTMTHELVAPENGTHYTLFKTYQTGGMLRSGKPFVCVSSHGDLKHYDNKDAMSFVERLKDSGWRDLRDPGYDKRP